LATAFKAGQDRVRAMLMLGAMYAAGFMLIMGITTLFDGGQFAKLYLLGGKLSKEVLEQPDFQAAAWIGMGLYLPLSMLFWHAPALVHWHGVSPTKALFFSMVACLRNLGAYTVYAICWVVVFTCGALVIATTMAVLGLSGALGVIMVPVALTMAAMLFTSIYFTFRDSFIHAEPNDNATPQN
jgi:hypothetical protein